MIIRPYTDPGRTLLSAPPTKMASEGTGILRESYVHISSTKFSSARCYIDGYFILNIFSVSNVTSVVYSKLFKLGTSSQTFTTL